MLPKNKRLSTRRFDAAFSVGAVIRTAHFLVRHHGTTKKTQWAVVVPKKHIHTAVQRNALRRKIFSAVQTLVRDNVFLGHYIIILTNPAVLSVRTIEQELQGALVGRAR